MRLKLVPSETSWDFFGKWKIWLGISALLIVVGFASFLIQGLNYGIDFRGGTTIRIESTVPVDVAAYRTALEPAGLGDISITEVFDPTFAADQHVAMVRIEAQEGDESVTGETISTLETALRTIDPEMTFPSVESVGPKVSGELIQTAAIAVFMAIAAVLIYIWLRFEWQFAVGAVIALVHDVVLTLGIFSELQIKFDLAIIAALLTIVGYSINDTVVVYDRIRENFRRYKKLSVAELINLSINETLTRTVMTSVTTLLALVALYIFGGEVIRGFATAMIFGVIVGTYSSIFVAAPVLLHIGLTHQKEEEDGFAGAERADGDAEEKS
jgi:preprotein translocase subunit SecF